LKRPLEVDANARVGTGTRCRECGAYSPAEASFCIECGSGLYGASQTWSEAPEAPPDPLLGRVLAGRYRILAQLGSGGMGVVYRVEHVHIGKVMALKVLHDDLARRSDVQMRFQREAEAASRLASAHTVQVFDFGESDGRMYLVMEYIEGTTLEALVTDHGALPFARAARIAAQICASATEAHAQGIVHRDIKPENVMIARIDGRETAKVLDFGLAKLRAGSQVTTVTTTGLIVGTPEYMSPEQIRGEPIDARGDIYAIGALLYHVCTGDPPFVADAPFAILTKHLTEPVVPPSRVAPGHVPREADWIFEKALAKDPADRFGSAAELRAALVAFLRGAGEDLTDPALRLDGAAPASPSRPRLRIGTMDLDLERRGRAFVPSPADVPGRPTRPLQRGRWASGVVLALALAFAVVSAYELVRRDRAEVVVRDPSVEHEPNDELATAAALPERTRLSGHIGQRRSRTEGDVDIFRLAGSGEGGLPVRVDVGAIPNIDLVLEVLEAGQVAPRFVIDGGGVGEGEIAPNLPGPREDYVVRIRERVEAGGLPVENVSDRYTLRWQRARVADELEREPNDSLETAQRFALGAAIEGYVGYSGDIDVYCLEGEGGTIVARVGGLAEVDVLLRAVDRVAARSRRFDTGGAGEGEQTGPIADARAGRTCFEVSAKVSAGARSAGPEGAEPSARSSRGDARYTFGAFAAPEVEDAPVAAGSR
jgi:eukaryotic-like serine/threonine-protein kinase